MHVAVTIVASALLAAAVVYTQNCVWMPLRQDDASFGRMPLVELPAAHSDNDTLAVVLSGDGGWADLDRQFGDELQQHGIATLGIDCLRYFWKKRTPQQVSADLEDAIRHYLTAWSKRRMLLVGYSFGASWLPSLVNRMPLGMQQRISLVALLGLPVLCVFGREETGQSICSTLAGPDVSVAATAGDHHLDGYYEPLIQRLIETARQPPSETKS